MKDLIKTKIGRYIFNVEFVSKDFLGENTQGKCCDIIRTIYIRNDFDKGGTELVLTHELTHALLSIQGRTYQKQFELEDVCEFVAWGIDDIILARDKVIEERFGKQQ